MYVTVILVMTVGLLFAYLSVEIEIAEYHEHSADFGEQRCKDESKAKRQKKRAHLKCHW